MSGTLYGIGVGPGDPELLTLKAARLLASIPVIAWPAPLEGESLARRIAAAHIPAGRTEIALRLPFAIDQPAASAYDEGAAKLASHLDRGQDAAVLCEGDPLLFGSFCYLLERLGPLYPVSIVPGVTSPSACAALASWRLATGGDALALIPASRAEHEIESLLAAADSAVVMKPARHLGKIARIAERLGWLDGAMYVERAGQPGERVISLGEAAVAGAEAYFALILMRRPKMARN